MNKKKTAMTGRRIVFSFFLLIASQTAEANDLLNSAVSRKVTLQEFLSSVSSYARADFSCWKNVEIEDAVTYFDLSHKPISYCFPITKNGTDVGIIMVDSSSAPFSIQEFSFASAPHKANLSSARRVAQNCVGINRKLGKPSFLCPAPFQYLVRFPVIARGKEIMQITIDLLSLRIVSVPPVARSAQMPEEAVISLNKDQGY